MDVTSHALTRTGEINIGQIWGMFLAAMRAAEHHKGLTVNRLLNVTSRLPVMFAVPLLVHCMGVKRLRHPPGGWKNLTNVNFARTRESRAR
ncbi:MAG: hypothetical protein MPJ50_05835, partial [Pirellulales bacterium]|nr:hypothetical protein [Pirellulales bacterium]